MPSTHLSAPVVMIIVASLALGLALTRTGGADWLAHLLVEAYRGALALRW